nr:transporter substrate-binding domain-containing protein [uncultured Deefgea sp.]
MRYKMLLVACAAVVNCAQAADLVGFTEEFAPFNYTENGQNKGLANEIIDRITAKTGLRVERKVFPWLRAIEGSQALDNSLLFTTVRTPERESKFLWVGPFDDCEIWLIKLKSRKDVVASNLEQAKQYRVGAPRGSAGNSLLLSKGFKEDKLDLSLDEERNIRKLYAGRFDYSVGMIVPHYAVAKKLKLPVADLEPVIRLEKGLGCYFAFNPKVEPKLFQRFSDAFSDLEKSGELEKIRDAFLN